LPLSPYFSGPGLDRADALRADPGALAALAGHPDARQLLWAEGLPLIDEDGRLCWSELTDPALFLGLDGDAPRFSAIATNGSDSRAAFPRLAELHADDAPLFAAALSLAGWHARHGFCASCGSATDIVRCGWSRKCPSCSAEHYPRVDPVVIMLVEHENSLLLGRQPQYPPGRYSALAGFVEVGDTIEDAVAREVLEEVGVAVDRVRYIASQPWPFPSSLMVGCVAAARSSALTIDYSELDDARWFTREEVAEALSGNADAPFLPPPRWAIARSLLEHWLAA
jgi:NAD+ diphosphatase